MKMLLRSGNIFLRIWLFIFNSVQLSSPADSKQWVYFQVSKVLFTNLYTWKNFLP